MKRINLFVFLLSLTAAVSAATIQSTTTGGNWGSTATWSGNAVPTSSDDVIINGTVAINGNYTCKTVTIGSGKTLSFQNGGAHKLTISNTNWATVFTNNGTFTANDGTVEFQASNNSHTISGTVVFNNVILSNVNQANFGSGSTINGTLRLNNGAYITTHPYYGSNSTLEINGNYNLNGNYYFWPNTTTASMLPMKIVFVSGTTSMSQMKVPVRGSISILSGATMSAPDACFTLLSTFTSLSAAGTANWGSITVASGATWNISSNLTINKLKIESGATVNANSYSLNVNATSSAGCDIDGMVQVVSGGTFNAGTGTVILTPGNYYSVNGNVTFNNVVISNGGSGTVNIPTNNTVAVTGNMTVNSGATVNQPNNITYEPTATVTNNGSTSNGAIPPTVPATPSTNTYLTGSDGGSKSGAASVQSSNTLTLTSNMTITGTRKVLTVSPSAELVMGSYTINADTVYLYGKLTVPSSISASLGSTVLVIGSGSTINFASASAMAIPARTDYVNLQMTGAGVKTLAAGTFNISGDMTSTGGSVSLANNPTLNFNGTNAQNIMGLPYKNLNFSGSGNKTFTDTAKVTGTITVSGTATLVSNGLLTLTSNASGTASIGTIASGASVSGNVNWERYIPASSVGRYRFLSLPLTGVTFAGSWQNQIHITGTGTGGSIGATNSNGFDMTASNNASAFWYNEASSAARDSRWTSISSTSNTINPVRGYRLFIRGNKVTQGNALILANPPAPQAVTLKATGEVQQGDVPVALTCSNGCTVNDGWMLVANPYPSAINWADASWITARGANISSTIYIYNPTTNNWATYNSAGGSPTNGGSQNIGSGQAFYVKANANNQTLTFKESYKVANTSVGIFGKNSSADTYVNNLKLQIGDNNSVFDETVVFMNKSAVKGQDDMDALKQGTGNASISTYTTEYTSPLVYNAIPELGAAENDTINVYMPLANATYTYNLGFQGIESFVDSAISFVLVDAFTNSSTVLTEATSTYSFSTVSGNAASYAANRFTLIINGGNGSSTQLPVKMAYINAKKAGNASVISWATASEQRNDRFEVERSVDGFSYIRIGSVKGAGTTNDKKEYSFIDEKPEAGVNYYRLKQIDQDATEHLSSVVTVFFGEITKNQVTVGPIPAEDHINVNLNNYNKTTATVTIVNMVGQVMLEQKINAEELNFSYPVALDNFNSGVYFISIKQADGKSDTIRFVKK